MCQINRKCSRLQLGNPAIHAINFALPITTTVLASAVHTRFEAEESLRDSVNRELNSESTETVDPDLASTSEGRDLAARAACARIGVSFKCSVNLEICGLARAGSIGGGP